LNGSFRIVTETRTVLKAFCKIHVISWLHCRPLEQESALAVAKIVLAAQFDGATLQEIRALVAESSSMRIFLRGEVFELRHREMGVLLEGFVRQENSTEIVTAPAGLILKTPLLSPAGQCTLHFYLWMFVRRKITLCTIWSSLQSSRRPKSLQVVEILSRTLIV
jgi:hypothetical protein